MNTRIATPLSIAVAALALAGGLAAAAPTLATEYRYASQISEYFVRGDAAVSESTVLKRGLRLAAWDAEDEQEASRVAVASAVYFFQVPLAARAVTIEVAYRPDEAARDKKVAGFLFVRNKAIEDQFAEQNKDNQRPVEEPGFFGNTYFLPAGEPRVTITLPTQDTVIDGVLEVHLTAGAGQVFDAQYVQVTALGADVAPRIEEVAAQNYVADPYAYSNYYYYSGPSYYPYADYYDSFYVTSFDPIFWHQWTLRRANYLLHHSWCYRPRYYDHRPLIVVSRPFYVFRPLTVRYRDDWYRRSFHIDPDRFSRDDIQHLVRRPTGRLSVEETRQRGTIARQLVTSGRQAEGQLRQTLGDRFYDTTRDPRRADPQAVRALQSLRDHTDIQRSSDAWTSLHAARWNADDRRPTPKQDPTPRPVRVERERPTVAPTTPQFRTVTTPKALPTRPTITEERPTRHSGNDGFPGTRIITPAPVTPEPTDPSDSKSRTLRDRFRNALDGTATPSLPTIKDNPPRRSNNEAFEAPKPTTRDDRRSGWSPRTIQGTPTPPPVRVIETPPTIKSTPPPPPIPTAPTPVPTPKTDDRRSQWRRNDDTPAPRRETPTPPPVVRERPTPPSPPPTPPSPPAPRSDDTPRVRRDTPPPSKDDSDSTPPSSNEDSQRGRRRR